MSDDNGERVTVRLPSDVRRGIEKLALADKREMSSYIRKLLWEHVEAAEKDGRLSAQAELTFNGRGGPR